MATNLGSRSRFTSQFPLFPVQVKHSSDNSPAMKLSLRHPDDQREEGSSHKFIADSSFVSRQNDEGKGDRPFKNR
jgi:hypothetical protein